VFFQKAVAELFGPERRGFHRVHQRRPQAARLEGVQTGDRRAARAGDLVLEGARVLAGLEQQLGRAIDRLCRELERHVA
jgi:hypothetical protein